MPEILRNLVIDEFAHPDDLSAVNALENVAAVNKIVSMLEDQNNQTVIRMMTLGNCVKLTEKNERHICKIVHDTCEVINYDRIPEIYTKRDFSIDIVPSGVEKPVIIIPDFVIENFSDDLLYFTIGRAITRLKSSHLKFFVAAQLMITATGFFPIISDAIIFPLANWMRKSELTADRGGLLVSQNYNAAMRFLMCKAGMPLKETEKISVPDYIDACKSGNKIANVGKGAKVLKNCTGWSNDRIIELFMWHAQGSYDDLLEKYI